MARQRVGFVKTILLRQIAKQRVAGTGTGRICSKRLAPGCGRFFGLSGGFLQRCRPFGRNAYALKIDCREPRLGLRLLSGGLRALGIEFGAAASGMRDDYPTCRTIGRGVDGDDRALSAETVR